MTPTPPKPDSVNTPSTADLSKTTNKDTISCTGAGNFKGGQQCFKGGQQGTQTRFTNSQINKNPLQEKVNSGGNEHTKLNKEEIEKLKNLLGTFETPNGACSLTQSSKYSPSLAFSISDMPFLSS